MSAPSFPRRLLEVLLGFGLLVVVAVVAVRFFEIHQAYENAGSRLYLIALAGSVIFLIGLSYKLLFFGFEPQRV